MAALLAQEGANLHKRNSRGLTPLELCSEDVASLIRNFASNRYLTYVTHFTVFANNPSFIVATLE